MSRGPPPPTTGGLQLPPVPARSLPGPKAEVPPAAPTMLGLCLWPALLGGMPLPRSSRGVRLPGLPVVFLSSRCEMASLTLYASTDRRARGCSPGCRRDFRQSGRRRARPVPWELAGTGDWWPSLLRIAVPSGGSELCLFSPGSASLTFCTFREVSDFASQSRKL